MSGAFQPGAVEEFRVRLGADVVDDLRARLGRTRWPEEATTPGWSQGTPLAYAQGLCSYWADGYDFAAAEARLNRHAQFRAVVGGLGVHFVHVRSPRADATPLLLTHGWPGSVVEFADVVGPLADPPPGAPAFHVVCPSLPGYGFSDKPAGPGWTVHRIADAWAELMTRLGYARFIAQGHDWGTSVSTAIAQQHPDRVIGLHLVPPLAAPDPAGFDDLTDAERRSLADLERAGAVEDGYSLEQSTRPQTIGYGLADSPAGQCAWIIEKFWAWTDCDGHPENALSRDELLDNVSLYWFTNSSASSARLYWESFNRPSRDRVEVPVGCSIFPKEIFRSSRRWAQRRFSDLRYWNELEKGGHFAAFEQPELYVDELRSFFRLVR